jgi:hypothetical protein
MVGPPFQDTGDGTQYKGRIKDNVNKVEVYMEEDDRIGWCEAGGNECEIDFWERWRIGGQSAKPTDGRCYLASSACTIRQFCSSRL